MLLKRKTSMKDSVIQFAYKAQFESEVFSEMGLDVTFSEDETEAYVNFLNDCDKPDYVAIAKGEYVVFDFENEPYAATAGEVFENYGV